jgi:hypothetical protein
MAQQPQLNDWLGGTYSLQGNSMACREAINCYLQSGEGGAKYQQLLIGSPGSKLLIDLEPLVGADAGCRGLWLTSASPYESGNLYWVYGSKLGYSWLDEVSGELKSKVLYDLGLSTNRVSMCDNGFDLVIATGTEMLCVNIFTDVVTDITASLPFELPLQVVYLMGRVYAISGDPSTTATSSLQQVVKSNLIWYSELSDARTWEGLSYVAADLTADPITAIAVRQGDIWAYGARSYQIFTTQENAEAPLAYAPGSGTYVGINAPYTASSIGETVFWLGSNASGRNVVFRGVGFNSTRVSTHGIESYLTRLGVLTTEAYGYAYQESGHLFYCLTIPAGFYEFEGSQEYSPGVTLVFDTLTEQWHQRASRDPKTGVLGAWQPLFSVYAFGRVVVGNLVNPVIMDLRNDVYTEYDPNTPTKTKPILRRYQGPIFYDNLQSFILDEFQADVITGHGPLNGLSANPTAQLQISYDSGNTWGSISTCSLQRVGNYAGRARWVRLGSGRNLVVRLTITEDLQFTMGAARLRTRVSRNP